MTTANPATNQAGNSYGRVTQVIGPVVDVTFDQGDIPEITTALRVSNPAVNDKEWNLVLEVAQHLGENAIRAISVGIVKTT